MARSRITINGLTSSYYEAGVGDTVQLTNDGEGDEVSVLWVAATGSQPSGSYDGFSDPLSSSPTITVRKEGNYLIRNLVDSTLTGSAVISVRHQKSNLESPAAGEKSEKNEEFGWARAVQNLASMIDDLYGDGGTIVGLAKHDLSRGDLVRPSGSLLVKAGLPGEERVIEFARISGEQTGSFQSTLYVVEGAGPSGSQENPSSGSLFKARLYGLFGPITGTFVGDIKGSPVFPRSDGIPSLDLDVVDRKIGTVIDYDSSSYYMHFDGTSDWRQSSTGSGGSSGINVQNTGSSSATAVTTLNFSGSGGISFSVSESPEGTALIVASGSSNSSSGGSLLDVQETGSIAAVEVNTLNFSGSGGVRVSVSETPGGTAFIDISGTLVTSAGNSQSTREIFVDRIYVSSSTNEVIFGEGGHGEFQTSLENDGANYYELYSCIVNDAGVTSEYQLKLSQSVDPADLETKRRTYGGAYAETSIDGVCLIAMTAHTQYITKTTALVRPGYIKTIYSYGSTGDVSSGDEEASQQSYTAVYNNPNLDVSFLSISSSAGHIGSGSFFDLYKVTDETVPLSSSNIEVQFTGSTVSEDVTILNFSGSGVSVTEEDQNTVNVNIPPAGVYLLDRIYVTSSTDIVKFGPNGDGQYKTEIDGDSCNSFELVYYIKRQSAEATPDRVDFELKLSESMDTSAIYGERTLTFGTSEDNQSWDGRMTLAYSDNNHVMGKGYLSCRTGFAKIFNSDVVSFKESGKVIAKHVYSSIYYDLTSSVSYIEISSSNNNIASGSFFELYRRAMI